MVSGKKIKFLLLLAALILVSIFFINSLETILRLGFVSLFILVWATSWALEEYTRELTKRSIRAMKGEVVEGLYDETS